MLDWLHLTRIRLRSAFQIDPDDDLLEADDEGAYEGDVPRVDPGFQLCSSFVQIWDDKKTDATDEASAFRPRVADGQVFFGDVFCKGRPSAPSEKVLVW